MQLLDGVEEQASKVTNLALEALDFDRRPILQVSNPVTIVPINLLRLRLRLLRHDDLLRRCMVRRSDLRDMHT